MINKEIPGYIQRMVEEKRKISLQKEKINFSFYGKRKGCGTSSS